MGQDAFVDVAYRGLEVGRRLKLHEVGPNTAYLEHGTPMPVGADLLIRTDGGLSIPVVVIRVHEQVAGNDMPPGMRVKAAQLEGEAASWWGNLVTRGDPEIPELPLAPMVPMPPAEPHPEAAHDDVDDEMTEAAALAPAAHDTAVMNLSELAAASEAEEGGNGAPGDLAPASGRTRIMSAVEISEITDTAGEGEPEEGSSEPDPDVTTPAGNGAPGSNGDEMQATRGRGKRRRKRR